MDEHSQYSPLDSFSNYHQHRTVPPLFNAQTRGAYSQLANSQNQFSSGFHPPYTPSPPPRSGIPHASIHDASVQQVHFVAQDYHGVQPLPPIQMPIDAAPPARVPSTPRVPTPRVPEEASTTSSSKSKPTGKPGGPKKGKGSRSGKNARAHGQSDTEIEALDDNTKKEAEIIVPARWDDASALKLVEFIAAPERWDKVTTSLSKICQEASQILFKDKYTVAQCITKWQGIFRLYKETRHYLNHTGGGDGDEDIKNDDSQAGSDEDVPDDEKPEQEKDTKKGKKRSVRYSPSAMLAFSEGPLYPILVRVAGGRADIDRAIEFSSHRKPQDIDKDLEKGKKRKKSDTDDEFEAVLTDTLRSVKERQAEAGELENKQFQYQKSRDDRVEQRETKRIELEQEKMMIERQRAELHRKRDIEELRFAKLDRYRQLRDSTDPLEQAFARKLGEEIRIEQGL